jgi:MOSC domain-containing protein YiiM
MSIKVVSVNVGLPREIEIEGRMVSTGIFKTPVAGPVRLRTLNLDGDRQADLTVHGGVDKAVYLYPSEHYAFWQKELEMKLDWGGFGENLTIEGLDEKTTGVGDRLEIGSTVLQITQPRLPCFKLAAKFQRDDIIQRFLQSHRSGFYARVLEEGTLQAGDSIRLERDPANFTIHELVELYLTKRPTPLQIQRAVSVKALSAAWREHFQTLL